MYAASSDLEIIPVTKERWNELETLFGPSGAYSGCWCMWWRIKSKDFEKNGNHGNKAALQDIVARDEVPGLIAVKSGQPVGWLSLGPREAFGRLNRPPLFKAVDEQPVWSIVCFFIHRDHRNQGIASRLIEGAIEYAKSQGAKILEAYPIDTGGKLKSQAEIFTGTQAMFEASGFKEIARRKATRPILRKSFS